MELVSMQLYAQKNVAPDVSLAQWELQLASTEYPENYTIETLL